MPQVGFNVAPFSITNNKGEVSIFSVNKLSLCGVSATNLATRGFLGQQLLVKLISFQMSVMKYFSVLY